MPQNNILKGAAMAFAACAFSTAVFAGGYDGITPLAAGQSVGTLMSCGANPSWAGEFAGRLYRDLGLMEDPAGAAQFTKGLSVGREVSLSKSDCDVILDSFPGSRMAKK